MLLQKSQIGKTIVIFVIIILLTILAAMPLFLQADSTGETTPEANLFLPVVLSEEDSTPDPGANATPTATATICPQATPEIFLIDPVTSPTSELSQTLVVRLGRGEWVRASGPAGTVTVNAPDLDGLFRITVPLAANTTNDILVEGKVELVGTPGETCVYGDYILSRTVSIVQESPTATFTPTPTSIPIEPYIVAVPDCGPGPNIFFLVQGYNWPVNESITLTWNDNPMIVMQADQHSDNFSFGWTFEGMTSGLYKVSAISGTSGITASDYYTIPCGASITPTVTQTPEPADLVIGQPILISTPPIITYQPLAFEVPITNTGEVDINTLFFVDLLFDPTPVHHSDVYAAVSGLDGNSSMTLTITSTIGLANYTGPHHITGMVDSLDKITETNEGNNLSPVLEIPLSIPGNTPTNTPVPNGAGSISGIVRRINVNFIPVERASITVIDETTGISIASTYSDENGYYELNNLPDDTTYTIQACIMIDNSEYFGVRVGKTPVDTFADIYLNKQQCP